MICLDSTLCLTPDSASLTVQLRSNATAADDLYALARRFGPRGTPLLVPVSSSPTLRRQLEDALRRAGYVRDRDTVGEDEETWRPELPRRALRGRRFQRA